MSMNVETVTRPGAEAQRDPGAIAGSLIGPVFMTAILGAIRLANRPIPRPGSPATDVRDYYTGSSTAVRFSSTVQLVSVAALARFSVSVARVAGDAGSRPRLYRSLAFVSGGAAVVTAAGSAMTHAALTAEQRRTDDELLRGARRVFVLGGPVHGVAFGLLTGVLSAAGRRTGTLGPRAANVGLATAAAGVMSPLYFRWENAGWLIPIGRFGGYAICAIAGVRLARENR